MAPSPCPVLLYSSCPCFSLRIHDSVYESLYDMLLMFSRELRRVDTMVYTMVYSMVYTMVYTMVLLKIRRISRWHGRTFGVPWYYTMGIYNRVNAPLFYFANFAEMFRQTIVMGVKWRIASFIYENPTLNRRLNRTRIRTRVGGPLKSNLWCVSIAVSTSCLSSDLSLKAVVK
jgi:hypothetical protein